MTINNGDILKIEVNMRWDDTEQLMHIYHYQLESASQETDEDCQDAILDWLEDCYAFLIANQANNLDYNYLGFYNVTQDYPMSDVSIGGWTQPAETGTPLPLQTCGLLIFRTATKRSVGKKFIPGFLSVATLDGNSWDTTPRTALTNFGSNVVTPVEVNSSYLNPGNYNEAADSFRPWISSLSRPGIYTQRRRRPGVGS